MAEESGLFLVIPFGEDGTPILTSDYSGYRRKPSVRFYTTLSQAKRQKKRYEQRGMPAHFRWDRETSSYDTKSAEIKGVGVLRLVLAEGSYPLVQWVE